MRHHGSRSLSLVVGALLGSLLLGACQSNAAPDDEESGAGATSPAATEGGSGSTAAITLAFAGDVHFEAGLVDVPGQDGSTLGPMSQALRSADLAMVNLESAITRRGEPTSKELEDAGSRYWFRSPPAALDVLDARASTS